jgi:hypothetical protein
MATALASDRPMFVQMGEGSGRYSPLLMELMILWAQSGGKIMCEGWKCILR